MLLYLVKVSITRKTVMAQYGTALDLTAIYQESFATFDDALTQVEKEQEYVQFIRENTK